MKKAILYQTTEAALVSFRSNPLRSTLTITGIVVGIAAVVAVLAIGKGNQAKIQAEVDRMGPNLFWVQPGPNYSMNPTGSSMIMSFSAYRYRLTRQDVKSIEKRCSAATFVAPVSSFFLQGEIDGRAAQFNVIATTPSYQKIKKVKLVDGRYLCDMDLVSKSNVCVAEENPGMSLVSCAHHHLSIEGIPFKIVGVVKNENPIIITSFPSETLQIPITVARQEFAEGREITSIYCLADESNGTEGLTKAMQQVKKTLKATLLLNGDRLHNGRLPFQVKSSREVLEQAKSRIKTATMVTAGVGMLSLFVGGIGIMNILLASVSERTREIGVCKTVGARRRDILYQFLFESVVLSACGGILGVILGTLIGNFLAKTIGVPPIIDLQAVLVGFSFSLAVGTVFGVYPAWKASNMAPIDALRYE